MRKTAAVIAVAVACGVVGTGEAAQAVVLCRNKTSNVVTSRSVACKRGEARLDITQFIATGGIAGTKLADGAVTEGKLAAGAVTDGKLAAGVDPKFLSLNVFGAFLGGAASFSTGFGPNAGLLLADNANSDFSLGFTVPPNYTPGTSLAVRVLWHTPAMPCVMEFRPNFISVARAGSTHLIGPGASTGLSVAGGPVAALATNQSVETLVMVNSPVAGANLAPGDVINFGLFRFGAAVTDTCLAPMVIQGLGVEYQ